MNSRLRGDQLPDARIAKDLPELRIVCAFDDKIAVKILMPDLHVLHAQVFAEFGKNSLAIDGKAKTARIQKGRTHAGVVVPACPSRVISQPGWDAGTLSRLQKLPSM
jgi:hypothetical protein